MELYEINNALSKTKEELESFGFEVIRVFDVKKKVLSLVKDKNTLDRLYLFNKITYEKIGGDDEINELYNTFEKIILKDSRGDSHSSSVSYETLNGYLNYRPYCWNKWF